MTLWGGSFLGGLLYCFYRGNLFGAFYFHYIFDD